MSYTFMADAEVENNILEPKLVPSHILTPAYLGEFLRGVLGDNNKHFPIQHDKIFQKIQQKLLNVMRPLSKTWQKIEEATQSINNRTDIDIYKFKELTEQSTVVLGQGFKNIMYNSHLSVLTALMKEHKAKQLLKEKTNIFSESYKELLGKTFPKHWYSNLKMKQVCQEVLWNAAK